jgi:hypothetical protein
MEVMRRVAGLMSARRGDGVRPHARPTRSRRSETRTFDDVRLWIVGWLKKRHPGIGMRTLIRRHLLSWRIRARDRVLPRRQVPATATAMRNPHRYTLGERYGHVKSRMLRMGTSGWWAGSETTSRKTWHG